MKEIGAGKTSLFFNLVPVVTMIISLAIGTPITAFQLIGACLVIAGVLTASGVISFPKPVPAPRSGQTSERNP